MSARATILYVEDNPDNRTLVRRVLQMEGYQVVEAQNAAQAMERLQSESIDLALMDINMPDVDGYTLTAQIKSMARFANMPIVAVTANVMRGDRERSLQAGCDGYIQKPIDIDTLAEQVERFLPRVGVRPAAALSNTTPASAAGFIQIQPTGPVVEIRTPASNPVLSTTSPAANPDGSPLLPKVRRKRVRKPKTAVAPTDTTTPDAQGSSNA